MTQHIPMFPEVEADLKPAEKAAIWKPTTIAEIKKFKEAYCDNCAAQIDYDIFPCDLVHEIGMGIIESDEAIKVTSSGEPKCECFIDVNA